MIVLVTGGAGFIGSHTCIELLNDGYEVIVIDNLSNSNIESIVRVEEITRKKIKFYNFDLSDHNRLEKIFLEHKIDIVVHLAGFKAVGESVLNPLNYYKNNLNGTITLCEVMSEYNVKKLIFSSSATVYSQSKFGKVSECSPLGATNPYGRTKLMIEKILGDIYISDHDWSIATLRYFNPIGAHSSGLIGEDPNGIPNNLVPYISQVASGKLEELKIFGNDYDTLDGTGVRDYIHVVDLAKGHLCAINRVKESKGNEAYNLGTGSGYSVMELIDAFEKVTGKKVPFRIVERRPGDIAICYADVLKANRELGWKAEKGIKEMCYDAWIWQTKNPNGYKTSEVTTV
ncbi:UDP-glucose 4-epimerase [Paenibacillus helianthi]|uniref:UDP-glucose 4-epimerase n=1 Tax=Paenibacillus helianthi TaxID=1349432 RepID=A0ABX3EGI0_9BACL|nr:UDP-glucose 4-epimerase GalE [Paenibacillus helianthi]OKP78417.1 UDP-glucose 4-epimerase [Paenibacillus helianthi]